MKRRNYHRSKKAREAKHFPKSNLAGYPCYKKTIYPTLEDAERGATMIWSKDPSADRSDLHGYECPDGCKINGQPGFHAGHKSYYEATQMPYMSRVDVSN